MTNESLEIKYAELEAYERIVSRLSDSKSDIVYYNSGKRHAEIVIKNILYSCKNTLNILTGSTNSLIFEYTESIERILFNGGNISAIVNEVDYKFDNSQIYKLTKDYPKNLKLFSISIPQKYHYIVSDNKTYRFEYDIEQYKAEFCFNGPERSAIFNKHFASILSKSTKI